MLNNWEERLRHAAVATRRSLCGEMERLKRKPTDVEVVIAALVRAHRVLQEPVAIPSALGGRSMELGCRIDGNAADERVINSSERTRSAHAVISIFDELASPPPGSRFDPAKDKAILDVAVKQFLRIGAVNDRAIGREIGLSHVQVAERKRTRCARIMGLFRKEWPAFFQLHSPRRPPGYSHFPESNKLRR